MNVLQLEQGTSEWLNWRRTKRMASETPAVTKRSPYQNWSQLRAIKLGGSTFQTAAMAHGHRHEEEARRWASAETGFFFTPVCIEDGEYGASLDGLESNSLLEVKSPYKGKASDTWQLAEQGIVRPDYLHQIIHQFAVSGATNGYYCVWDADSQSGILIPVEPNPDEWKLIQVAWDDFYAWMNSDLAEPDPERTDSDWAMAAAKYTELQRRLKRLEDEVSAAKDNLITLAGTAEKVVGMGVSLSKVIRAGNVNYKAVPELKGVDLDQYRSKSTESWRVTVGAERKGA